MVFGRAGIGKSTLCQLITWEWASDVRWCEFDLLFFIRLRDVPPYSSPTDTLQLAFGHIAPGEAQALAEASEAALDAAPQTALFLLDGYDEALEQAVWVGVLQPIFDRWPAAWIRG